MIVIIIILVASIVALSLGCYNLIKQNEALEESTLFYQTKLDEIRDKAIRTEIELKELDIRGAFEADDEVGFVFKGIKELQTELTNTIQQVYEFRD
jgi:hypothetical protein